MKFRQGLVGILAGALCVTSLVWLYAAEPVNLSTPEIEQALSVMLPERLYAHIRYLADDKLEGREAGTHGYDLAADYVASQFREIGLRPAGTGDSYFQPIRFRTTRLVNASLIVVHEGTETSLTLDEEFLAPGHSGLTETSVSAPVVFVGYGVSAPEFDYDDYAGLDVKGKVIAILGGAPAQLPAGYRSHFSSPGAKASAAASHGAAGIITLLDPSSRIPWRFLSRSVRRGSTLWLGPDGLPGNYHPELKASAILKPDAAQVLFQDAPRSLEDVVRDAKAGRLQGFPLSTEVQLSVTSKHEEFESSNVAAILRGSDPALREEYVIFSAHLDHTGISEQAEGDKINNGAYDNASGSAAILEVARGFASLPQAPKRSILFLTVTAEEKGLLGSEYFAQHPTVPKQNLVANINMDMFLMLYPLKDVVAFGGEHSSLGKVMEQAARHVGLELSPDPMPEMNLFVRSDHYSFVKQGIPAVFVVTGFKSTDSNIDGRAVFYNWMRTTYHKPGDDADQEMHLESGIKLVQANFLAGYIVANQAQRPAWNPGNFYGETFGAKAGQAADAH